LKGGFSFVKENAARWIRGGPLLPLGEEYYRELDYFFKCLLNDENPQPNVDDWLRVSKVLDVVYGERLIEDRQK